MSCISKVMQERISPWNGALYTRAEIIREMTIKGHSQRSIDWWTFHQDALTDAQITRMFEQGELLNNVPNVFPAWFEEVRWAS